MLLAISFFKWSIISFLALLVLASLVLLHIILIQEYLRQESIQRTRLKDIESQFALEVDRTERLSRQNEKLSEIKKRTREKLSAIGLKGNHLKY